MCVTFIYLPPPEDQHFPYKLIILNNRDEEFDRPTSKLAWENGILAGRDEQAKDRGTWFGVSKTGKIGILLSITQANGDKNPKAPSRGRVIKEYLEGDDPANEYCIRLAKNASNFNGFQFVCLDRAPTGNFKLFTLTNMLVDKIEPVNWIPGVIHGIGNSPKSKPFQKVIYGEKIFEKIIETFNEHQNQNKLIEELLSLGSNQKLCMPDPQLELQVKQSEDHYKYLTSLFVRFPSKTFRYGTRSHSILLVNNNNYAMFLEKRMVNFPENIDDAKWETTVEKFQISNQS